MNAMASVIDKKQSGWRPGMPDTSKVGYRLNEEGSGFRLQASIDSLVRLVGILLILGALIQWTIPRVNLTGNIVHNQIMLSIAFSIIGMAIYAYSIRGHRSEIVLDTNKGEIVINQLTRQNRVRASKHIPLRRIKSIYVRRKQGTEFNAALHIRHMDSPTEICAIRGQHDELEYMHRELCRDIRMVRL